jgi:uncharacterized protein (DUF2141 family)
LAALASLSAMAPPGSVTIDVTALRSAEGQVLLCMTAKPEMLAKCDKDPAARRLAVPVASARAIRFDGLPSGSYAIALVHDENSNNKMDTSFGMPREGFGFSRNPVIRFGPPRFAEAQFAVANGRVEEAIRVRYMF